MPEQKDAKQVCPYLGLIEDRNSRFSYPEVAHICFANNRKDYISLEHQSNFCFTAKYVACPRFVEPASAPAPVDISLPLPQAQRSKFSVVQVVLWAAAGLTIGLLFMLGIFYLYRNFQSNSAASVSLSTPTPVTVAPPSTFTATPTATGQPDTPTPQPVAFLATPTPTETPLPGIKTFALSPGAANIGWMSSGEERGNHFGDSYLYAGVFNGQIYTSGFQFDLSGLPRGAPIYQARLRLTGLREDRLAVHNDQRRDGVWMVRLLGPEIDENWQRSNYQTVFNAPALATLNPILSDQDLAVGKVNEFELSPAQLKILEERVIANENPKVSFRIDGPLVGADNMFAWDTGFGPQSRGHRVELIVSVGQPPATPPPFDFIVVTSTPTPQNEVTAAAISAQMTADATRIGTATPPPPNMVTATPIPDYLVLIPTATPENETTAQAMSVLATARALTTGTPTPVPTNAVTATPVPPTPTPAPPTPTPTIPPTPTLENYVLITPTPTAATVFEAATRSAQATALFEQFGPPTPLPTNWVTPIVVTSTPTPGNAATVEAMAKLAQAIALTTGTPTPLPPNVVTATPTPVFETIAMFLTPTPTGSPSPTPQSIPSTLLGKILFRSDREWSAEDVTQYWNGGCSRGDIIVCPNSAGDDTYNLNHIYVFDLDTGELGRLTNSWPYFAAKKRDPYSADAVYRTYNKQLLWTNAEIQRSNGTSIYQPTTVYAIHYYDYKYKVERQVTELGAGWAWDPVWSPTGNQIAFVSNDSGDDEIWVINHDGSNAQQLTSSNEAFNASEIGKDTFIPELNGHPSWSPDGSKIIFWSNRTGNRQLWIMNADGSDQQLLMGWDNWTPYNDWDPVWVKYLNPPPPEDQER